ncbi:MAG: nucleotidyltransferase, partial [Alphaproteobacteria bacterium]
MKALILSAGQGSRLLPMTEDTPKCLLRLNAMSALEWQVRQLHRCGVNDITVVTGFQAEKVDAVLMRLRAAGINVRSLFNPFYKVADNLASCWLARDEMDGDLIVLNGDTVFEDAVLEDVLARAAHAINVTV